MTTEDKQLLLADICARLPYGVICKNRISGRTAFLPDITIESFMANIEFLQPYLRPMSNMSDEELIEFNNIPSTKNYQIVKGDLPWDVAHYKQIEWLNVHHFDYRGLIAKGLAIEVTEDNNPYKD